MLKIKNTIKVVIGMYFGCGTMWSLSLITGIPCVKKILLSAKATLDAVSDGIEAVLPEDARILKMGKLSPDERKIYEFAVKVGAQRDPKGMKLLHDLPNMQNVFLYQGVDKETIAHILMKNLYGTAEDLETLLWLTKIVIRDHIDLTKIKNKDGDTVLDIANKRKDELLERQQIADFLRCLGFAKKDIKIVKYRDNEILGFTEEKRNEVLEQAQRKFLQPTQNVQVQIPVAFQNDRTASALYTAVAKQDPLMFQGIASRISNDDLRSALTRHSNYIMSSILTENAQKPNSLNNRFITAEILFRVNLGDTFQSDDWEEAFSRAVQERTGIFIYSYPLLSQFVQDLNNLGISEINFVNGQDVQGKTPLIYAIENNNTDTVLLYLLTKNNPDLPMIDLTSGQVVIDMQKTPNELLKRSVHMQFLARDSAAIYAASDKQTAFNSIYKALNYYFYLRHFVMYFTNKITEGVLSVDQYSQNRFSDFLKAQPIFCNELSKITVIREAWDMATAMIRWSRQFQLQKDSKKSVSPALIPVVAAVALIGGGFLLGRRFSAKH